MVLMVYRVRNISILLLENYKISKLNIDDIYLP